MFVCATNFFCLEKLFVSFLQRSSNDFNLINPFQIKISFLMKKIDQIYIIDRLSYERLFRSYVLCIKICNIYNNRLEFHYTIASFKS